ncbi:cytochrome c [Shimia aestuarii]|uniref:Cytochrome c, mono-and diheme variants n=1 Tax=Shimia aestuarii TaxID=254406 RepID=A0A1I4NHJ7_9RHOB|nr:cytochrome c [Shimia aestuarii]SFM14978.1 Cytochrome c, mono-and diheme variants [Shimia aestuarii]
MRRLIVRLFLLGLLGFAAFWFLTRPETLPSDALEGLTADATRGETVFYAAGCASCHTAPNAESEGAPVLSGGQSFPSPFGTFIAPNISPDTTHGIGDWSALDLANAIKHGTSPDGQHYYPAFPYSSYSRATLQDITDLHAYMMTLPADATPSQPHDIGFPFNIRLSLGGWKFLFLNDDWITEAATPELERGRYLVEALGHCGECHTPRGPLGNVDLDQWLAGAPDPSGKGKIPGITPAQLDWPAQDLVYYFETGFTPDYDSAGGHMAHVIENLSKLDAGDREAIAAYLKALPAGQ